MDKSKKHSGVPRAGRNIMTNTIIVEISRDGNQICAIIGDMPEEIAVGFGDSVTDALVALADDIDARDPPELRDL